MNDCHNWSLQFLDHIARYINLCPAIGDQEFSFLLILKSFTYSDIILRARKRTFRKVTKIPLQIPKITILSMCLFPQG